MCDEPHGPCKTASPVVLGGADEHGTEQVWGGNEEEKELRHLKLTCVEETGKSCSFLFL